MKGQTHYGKGSAQRPTDKNKFDIGWENAFGNKLRGLRTTDNDKVLEQKKVQTVPEQAHDTDRQTASSRD